MVMPIEDYIEMGEIVRGLKGTAVISVSGHEEMRQAFKGLEIKTVDINYTVSKGRSVARKKLIIRKK